jgi:putative hydrolase of the HAD superfamily
LLIIFDLDDTLIDTSGCITPIKLKDALERMIAAGLKIEDEAEAYRRLLQINQNALSSRQALKEFLGTEGHFLEIGSQEVYGNISPQLPIEPFSGVIDTLAELSSLHQLALVTQGRSDQQFAKMKKAGIDYRIFSKVIASENSSKKIHYQAVVEDLKPAADSGVLVCGDKVAVDLAPAKELGMITVHMRRGRGKAQAGPSEIVDYTIGEFAQIKEILKIETTKVIAR